MRQIALALLPVALTSPLPDHWIVKATEALLVLDKPAGLLCQPGRGPALADSLITRVQARWGEARLVHRLDRDTSGLILVALSADLHRGLSRLFAARRVLKRYVADVQGRPRSRQGWIDLPLAKRQHQPPRYGVDAAGKVSRTAWWLRQSGGSGAVCRLELQPFSGRSHQLRVHLQAIGHPILGDPLYGSPSASGRLHLHAAELRFRHPHTGEALHLCSPVPFVLPDR